MKQKLVNYFFDSEEDYKEVEKYINVIVVLVPISLILTLLIRL